MNVYTSHISCGVVQVAGLEAYTRVGPDLDGLLRVLGGPNAPYCCTVVFSDADRYNNGRRLAKSIRTALQGGHGLAVRKGINPNSGNAIRTWVWSPNWADVAAYMESRNTDKERPVFTKVGITRIRANHRNQPDEAFESDDDDGEDF